MDSALPHSIFADYSERLLVLILVVALSIAFTILVISTGGSWPGVLLLLGTGLAILAISNLRLALVLLIASLYWDIHLSIFSSSVLISLLVLLAFIVDRERIGWRSSSSQLHLPLGVFLISILPSLINSSWLFYSAAKMLNLVAFIIAFGITAVIARSIHFRWQLGTVFIVFAVANSLDILRMTIMGASRPFGFGGIMFVDYSAMAVCLCLAVAMLKTGISRLRFLMIASIIALGLILTQTRNTWISGLATLIVMIVYLYYRPEVVSMRPRSIAFLGGGAISILLVIALLATAINPRVERKATELTTVPSLDIKKIGAVSNSISSRLLIWDTAWRAFLSHPWIGIGIYSFPQSSQNYARMPKFLFQRYVKGLSPHQTYLAMLAETGIIGALGFLYLILSVVRFAFRTIRLSPKGPIQEHALLVTAGLTYCVISMFFTDAWLWGQGIVLLGVLLGILVGVDNGRKATTAEPAC
jgi:O-antigen ligase